MAKNSVVFFLILFFSLLSVLSLFHTGLIPTHDGEYHVVRFFEFDKVLRSGALYPRIAPDLNNGYSVPLFNFVYPLPNYVASLFHAVGFSFIDAFKANLIAATLIGSLGMYLWSKIFWGRFGGFISSVVYSYAPYRLLDIYVRGSVGEIWALAIFPYVLFSITKIGVLKDKRYISVAAISITLLIFSHNILALLFSVFLLTYILFIFFQNRDKHILFESVLSMGLGVGMSAIFWLPAILEKQYVRGLEIFTVDRHFVEVYQLLLPSWGSGFSGTTSGNSLSFQIGVVNLIILMIAIGYIFIKKKSHNKKLILFLLTWVFISCFLMLPFSKSIWQIIPLMNFFQFPWRLLSLVVLLIGFLAGVISQFRHRYLIGVLIIVGSVLLTYSYTKPAYYHERTDSYYISQENFIHGTNSPGDVFNTLWFEQQKESFKAKFETESDVLLSTVSIQPESYSFNYNSPESTTVLVHTAFFPGWEASIDGTPVPLIKTDTGLMSFVLPEGTGSVSIVFTDTIIRQIGKGISFVSLCFVFLLLIKYRHYENRHR